MKSGCGVSETVTFPALWGPTKACAVCNHLHPIFSRGLCLRCFREARDRGDDLKRFGAMNAENEKLLPQREPWQYVNNEGERQLIERAERENANG